MGKNIDHVSSLISLNAVIILSEVIMVLNFFSGKSEESIYSVFWFSFFVKFLISYKYNKTALKIVVIAASFVAFLYYFVLYLNSNFNLLT